MNVTILFCLLLLLPDTTANINFSIFIYFQKPGPNLIRPIAFKPIHATSPSNHGSRHSSTSGDQQGALGNQDLARPLAMKLGTGSLGHNRTSTSPDKTTGSRPIPQNQVQRQLSSQGLENQSPASPHQGGSIGHFRSPNPNAKLSYHSPSASVNSSNHQHSHNASTNSHHNVSAASSTFNFNNSHLPNGLTSNFANSHHNHSHNTNNVLANNSQHHQHNHPSSSSYLNSSIGSHSHHNSSATSSHMGSCAEDSFSTEVMQRPSDRADSVPVPAATTSTANSSRGWHQQMAEGILQTPSPSDSGVGELEAILREKDAEINTLREVMDRNERAILQVYEERKNAWVQDANDLRDDYERKLKVQSRKSYKTEQVLSLQVYKLQQEQKSIIEEKEKVVSEKDSLRKEIEALKMEIGNLKSRYEMKAQDKMLEEEIPEELALKNKEIISLRTQLHSVQTDVEKKNKEMTEKVRELKRREEEVDKLKSEVSRLRDPAEKKESSSQTHAVSEISNTENVKPSMMGEREKTIQGLQDELLELRNEVLGLKDEHDRERDKWMDEKNKVIRYQKQLQLNYVQMQRKNASLENEVQQLTLELENRDMKLVALSGEESVC